MIKQHINHHESTEQLSHHQNHYDHSKDQNIIDAVPVST